jgi:hypothetical protein
MIVKVQLSIVTNNTKRQMLIYNKDKSFIYEGDATEEILESMEPKNKEYSFQKAYFHAHLVDDLQSENPNAKRIVLDKWADPQNW